MSTFNITKKTSNKIKEVSLALILTSSLIGVTLSGSVNAAPITSVENAVSDFVTAQGEKMIAELNQKLQQSIEKEIKHFFTNFSFDDESTQIAKERKEQKTIPLVKKIK